MRQSIHNIALETRLQQRAGGQATRERAEAEVPTLPLGALMRFPMPGRASAQRRKSPAGQDLEYMRKNERAPRPWRARLQGASAGPTERGQEVCPLRPRPGSPGTLGSRVFRTKTGRQPPRHRPSIRPRLPRTRRSRMKIDHGLGGDPWLVRGSAGRAGSVRSAAPGVSAT